MASLTAIIALGTHAYMSPEAINRWFGVPAGSTLPDLALRYILHHPAVSTTIPGMRKIRNVEANIASSDAPPLEPALIDALRAHRWDRNQDLP